MDLRTLVNDFADALAAVDAGRISHKSFQPGIGPFGEADAVRASLAWLRGNRPGYGQAAIRRVPDLLIPEEWAVEFKVVRPFGDNGKPAEHWSQNVLHPYPGNTSSLGDCEKLLALPITERRAIIIFGYEHTPARISLAPAISGFQILAQSLFNYLLTGPELAERVGLVHPVHQQLRVYGYEVLRKTSHND